MDSTGLEPWNLFHLNPSIESPIMVHWMEQKAQHKSKWLRFIHPSAKRDAMRTVTYRDILLYDFKLTRKGALKKKSREYLQQECANNS